MKGEHLRCGTFFFLDTFRQVYSKIQEQKVQKSLKDVCFH